MTKIYKVVVKTYNGDSVRTNTYKIEADAVRVLQQEGTSAVLVLLKGDDLATTAAFNHWDLVMEIPPAEPKPAPDA